MTEKPHLILFSEHHLDMWNELFKYTTLPFHTKFLVWIESSGGNTPNGTINNDIHIITSIKD